MSEIKYVTPSGLAHYDEKIKKVITEIETGSDSKVTQTPTTSNEEYSLLLSPSGQTEETNTTSYFNSDVVLNPSTKTISANIDGNAKTATTATSAGTCTGNSATATKATQDGDGNVISSTYSKTGHTHNYASSSSAGGAATSANKLNANAGSASQPVYFADGIPKACTHTLEKSVPADAVFTDTKYSVPSMGMVDLGFTVGSTCTVYEFFTKIYEKGLDKRINLHFRYDNNANAKISDGTTTIDVNGVSCFISIYGDVNDTWKKNYALLSVQNKMYLLYCIHSGNATRPSSQGIVDVTTDTYLPVSGGTINGSLNVNGTSNVNGIATRKVYKNDNNGRATYFLLFDITDWYLNGSFAKRGFNGFVYSSRTEGYLREDVATIIMDVAYQKSTTVTTGSDRLALATSNGAYRPCIIHDTTNDKYFLSLKITGSARDLILNGVVNGTLSTTQIGATDNSGTLPDGYEFLVDPADCKDLTISPKANGLNIYSTEPIKSTSDDTYENWLKLPGCSVSWYNNKYINGQPSRYGFLQNLAGGNGDIHQLWFTQIGSIYRRAGNTGGLGDWYEMLDSTNYSKYIANNLTTTASGYSLDARQGAQLLQYMGGVYGNFGTELQSLTVSPEYGSINACLNSNESMGNYKILEFDCYLTDAPQYMTTIRVPVDLFVYDKTITLCIQQQGQYMYCNAKKDSSYNIYYTFGGVSSGWSSYKKMSIRLRGLK